MPKVVLSTISSRYGSIDALNANFAAIEDALENTLSRDGTTPNSLQANLDANNFRIINLPTPVANSDAATKGYVDEQTGELSDYLTYIQTVAQNITAVVEVAPHAATITSNVTNINAVGDSIDSVETVANNIGSVQLVGLDLNGAFEQGAIYDFGAITDAPIGPGSPSASNIAIVATNIADVSFVADNIDAISNIEASVTAAANSASSASTSASNASSSASSASTSASNASTSASNASTSATNAASSASASASSATDSSTSAALANDWATKTSGPVAGGEYSAKYHAQASATSAGSASTYASSASAAQIAAEAARDATLAAYDNFDDRYLGAKTSDPSLDNDGNALIAGTLYFNSTDGIMKLYTGSVWVAAYISGAGYLAAANNLSELASAATARINLGLGSLATKSIIDTTDITNNAVTVDKLAASLDFGSIV